MNSVNYIVITPARNEAEHLGKTIASMAAQTLRPVRWILVNDGSSDATGAIIDEAASRHPWIVAVHREDRGFRQQGGGVMQAFYDGYARIGELPWDFLVKFDADLSLESGYFARCLAKFHEDPALGIGGGTISNEQDGRLVCESPDDPAFHVRGATKIYRRACWQAIGGLVRAAGWDTIDELKANSLGWTTRTFVDIPLRHHRLMGAVDGSWKNYTKCGLANYITGYHPLFMLAKCLKRLSKRPYLVGSVALWYGFCSGYLRRTKQAPDRELIAYLRRQQLRRLFLRDSIWAGTVGEQLRRAGPGQAHSGAANPA